MLAEPAAKALAAANGISCIEGLKDLIVNERFQALALKEIQTAGKKGGLAGIEIVSGVVLVGDEWTPQNVSQIRCALLLMIKDRKTKEINANEPQ